MVSKDQQYQFPPKKGFILTHFLTVADVKRSADFYKQIFGAEIIGTENPKTGEPIFMKIANSWLIINIGGGPTDDKPTVTLDTPKDKNKVSSFMNIRVADIWYCYNEWKTNGAEFLTEPKVHAHEIRCYMRDPDGYLIEVGQSTTKLS